MTGCTEIFSLMMHPHRFTNIFSLLTDISIMRKSNFGEEGNSDRQKPRAASIATIYFHSVISRS